MAMKKFLTILFLLPLLVGCEQENTLLTERDNIEKFLTSSRKMVPESEVGSVIEDNPAFYTLFGRYAYRYIVNYYDAEREDRAVVGRPYRARLHGLHLHGVRAVIFGNLLVEQPRSD